MTWVPPIQRSTPRSSTRSDSPASTLSPSPVSRSGSRAKRGRRSSGGGGGSGSPSAVSTRRTRPAAERRERSEEPGVAEERCLLELLRREECRGRRRAPAAIACSACRSVPREPVRAAQAAPRAAAAARRGGTAAPRSRAGPLGERCRLGRAEGVPGGRRLGEHLRGRRAPRRPERLQLVRGQLAQPVEDGLPGNEPTTISSGAAPRLVREREHVEELQLVVEVVLEPQHDRATRRAALR